MTSRNLDVLILTAGLGFGHHQASNAMTESLIEQDPLIATEIVDFLTLLPKTLAKGVPWGHQSLAKHWPKGYGMMYRTTSWMSQFKTWNRIEQRPGLNNLDQLLKRLRPKLVVAMHPMPLMAISVLRRDRRYLGKAVAIITDYAVHPDWVRKEIDHYCVATDDVREILLRRGFSAEHITTTGIPLRHAFHAPIDYSIARRKLGWDAHPRVLFVVGSQGMKIKRATEALDKLMKLPEQVHVVVITARDKALYQSLSSRAENGRRLTVVPYQNNIHEWMAASDLVITKAGALTISEVLSLSRPLLIFRPLPGQETGNTRWLMQSGAAVHCETPDELLHWTEKILDSAPLSENMESAASTIPLQSSATSIAKVCLELIGEQEQTL